MPFIVVLKNSDVINIHCIRFSFLKENRISTTLQILRHTRTITYTVGTTFQIRTSASLEVNKIIKNKMLAIT